MNKVLYINLEIAIGTAIQAQDLPYTWHTEYTRRFVYDAYKLESQDSDYTVKYVFLMKLVNTLGDFYRMKITTVEEPNIYGYPEYVVSPNA